MADRIRLYKPGVVLAFVALMISASALLTFSTSLTAVITAQILLELLLAIAGIHVSAVLDDAVPSAIRAGVASGVSTISWIGFLPFALVFGWATKEYGAGASGSMIIAATAVAGVLLARLCLRPPIKPVDAEYSKPLQMVAV